MTDTTIKILSVDEILEADDLAEEVVPVPQWGGAVKIRELTKKQQDDCREAARTDTGMIDPGRYDLELFLAGVVEPRFDASHVSRLLKKSADAFDLVTNKVVTISRIHQGSLEEAKARFRPGSAAGAHVPSGGEAGEDGEGAADGPSGPDDS